MTPVSDPSILNQLEAGAASPGGAPTPVDPTTAKFLDQLGGWSLGNSPVGGFVRGLRDPVDAGAQMLAHALYSMAPSGSGFENWAKSNLQNVNNVNRNAERDYIENWRQGAAPAFDVSRLAGNIVGTAPLAYAMPGALAPSLGARMLSGAATGAASSALQPVDVGSQDFWPDKLKQALVGAGIGGAAPAAFGAMARVVKPQTSSDVSTLMANGVRPTPGQMMGGTANRLEEAATSIPLLGDFIKSGRARSVEQFNRGAVNQALAPIGETLGSPLGRDAISEMQTKIGDFYDALIPHLGIPAVDPAGNPSLAAARLTGDLNNLRGMAQFMPADRATQFNNILQGQVFDKMAPGGGMTGQSWQDAKSALGQYATQYLNSSSADERQLGGALLQAQVAMRNALRMANPAAAEQLGAADAAYAQMLRVNNAAARPGAEPGIFSPAQLQAATKAMDPSLRKHVFAAGDALMQDYAEAGKSVLGNRVPDSGTPFRSLAAIMGGALLGHSVSPEIALGGAAAGGLAAGAYSPWGQAAMAHLMATRPALAAPIANAVRNLAPAGSAAAGPIWGSLAPTP